MKHSETCRVLHKASRSPLHKNLVVSLASADMSRNTLHKYSAAGQHIPSPDHVATSETPTRGRLAGRQFNIIRPIGNDNASFNWHHKGPSDDAAKDRLPVHISQHLAEHCHPHTPNGMLLCETSSFQERITRTMPIPTYMMGHHGMIMPW